MDVFIALEAWFYSCSNMASIFWMKVRKAFLQKATCTYIKVSKSIEIDIDDADDGGLYVE